MEVVMENALTMALGRFTRIIFICICFFLLGCPSKKKPEPELSPRGISLMHCNVDKARPQCEELVQIMLESGIKNIATNYLVNGTFGFNFGHMNHDTMMLQSDGRKLHLTLYMLNGAGQRRCRDTKDKSFEVKICPEQFRSDVVNSAYVRNEYRKNLERVKPLVDAVKARGGVVYIVPMLEDNLTASSFNALVELTKQVYPDDIIMRSPCGGCWFGNDEHVPSGVELEHHGVTYMSEAMKHSNDGVEWLLDGMHTTYPRSISLLGLMHLRNNSKIFELWSARYQGLTGGNLPPPSERTYVFPNEREKDAIIDFLKG
jgi:hypothetical protein